MESDRTWKWRLRHVLLYYRSQAFLFGAGFLLLVATTATTVAVPYLLKLMTEALTRGGGPEILGPYALGLMVLALVNATLRVRARTHIFSIGRYVECALRKTYQAKLLELDAAFFDREKTGDLVARGHTDITAVRMCIGPGFLQVSNTLIAYCVTLPVMISLDPLLTAMVMAPFPIVLGVAKILTKRLYRLSRGVADRFGKLAGFVQETIAGMAVIRVHAREMDWTERFDHESHNLYSAHTEHTKLQSFFSPLAMLSGGIGGWILLDYGGHKVAIGVLTIGDFVAFSGYLAILIWPTVGLGWILTVLQRGLAALERISTILDRQPACVADTSDGKNWRGERQWLGAIHIQDLTFSYDGNSPVLKNVCMTIPAGSFIGLAGRIGSGKSALLNCIARLYPYAHGSILIDGRDLLSISEAELRSHVVMTPQESFLFSATLKDNLLLGQPTCGEDKAWQALDWVAFADEVRQFPQQMASLVGERGITLSGGQRQRAALARALIADPVVLLLDDIFSSVDARTEETILLNLKNHLKGCTIIMVCHRVAALHNSDYVFVLDEGSVVAHGRHEMLLKNHELYRNLHSRMLRDEALEALKR